MSEAQNNQPTFSIEKVYVKDLSLEIPNAPQVFLEREAPSVDIQLHHNSTSVENGMLFALGMCPARGMLPADSPV